MEAETKKCSGTAIWDLQPCVSAFRHLQTDPDTDSLGSKSFALEELDPDLKIISNVDSEIQKLCENNYLPFTN